MTRQVKKIGVVGTVGVPACYGGFETLVENLIEDKSECHSYLVYCQSSAYQNKISRYKAADLVYIPFKANGWQSILYDFFCMIHSLFISKPDVMLVLGVSGCTLLPFIKRFSRSKIITNIDGLEWRREKWGGVAKKFLKLSERIAVRYSDVVVSDNAAITKYVKCEYGIDSEEIAYGAKVINTCDVDGKTYAFSLCRIEPENNVHLILRAFSRTELKLKFVGNWENSDYGKGLKEKYSKFENIEIIDPVYEFSELDELRRRCSVYVHGHSAGGTNPSLVEVMHYGVDILAFDCDYNRFSTENSALYFKSDDDILSLLTWMQDGNNSRGKKMQEIARKRYTWRKICNQYGDLF